MKAISDLEGTTTVAMVDTKALNQVVSIQSKLKEFGSETPLPLVDSIDSSNLIVLENISKGLTALAETKSFGQAPSVSSTQALEVISNLGTRLTELESTESFGLVSETDSSSLSSVLKLGSQFEELESLDTQLDTETKGKAQCFKESEDLLEELKGQGYPVGICSHCGHLSITEPFEIGSTVVSPHEHN